MDWTPEKTYTLIRAFERGDSLSVIGSLVGTTRSAVAGKVKRMGLPHRDKRALAEAGKASYPTREGQADFRAAVLTAYRHECCVTGSVQREILEAAHIVPYSMSRNHSCRNGLCLRVDIHALFDAGLISISPDLSVTVSRSLTDPAYVRFAGQRIALPENRDQWPLDKFVEWHNQTVFHP